MNNKRKKLTSGETIPKIRFWRFFDDFVKIRRMEQIPGVLDKDNLISRSVWSAGVLSSFPISDNFDLLTLASSITKACFPNFMPCMKAGEDHPSTPNAVRNQDVFIQNSRDLLHSSKIGKTAKKR